MGAYRCVCLCTFLVLGINFWSHIASLQGMWCMPQRPQKQPCSAPLRRRGGCGLSGLLLLSLDRPASVCPTCVSGALLARQQPGGHPVCPHTLAGGGLHSQPAWGRGAFGRAAAVVPGPWCGSLGLGLRGPSARVGAAPLPGFRWATHCRPRGPGAQEEAPLGCWQASTAPAGIPARVVHRPSPCCAPEELLLRNLGPTFLAISASRSEGS